ncbi:hypothetical protein [Bacteroides neonati]|uniref:hypothetical protein n=1 Tax=Bacteroides neonati TaxID=1347393 RepID=UPI0005A9C8D0|nr:hypothetical protein [Bacteroides neonati]
MKNRHASLLILCCLLLFASCHSHQGDDNRGVTYPQYVAILNINQSLQKKEAVFEKRYPFMDDANKSIFAESNAAFLIKDNIKCISIDECNGLLYAVLMNDRIVKYNVQVFLSIV